MNDPNPNRPEEAHSIGALAGGRTVGAERYLLKKVLGQGGMGVVWLAHDMRLRELTALKFLPPDVAADPAAVEDLRRETLRSRKLSHPNIVRIHDLWETKGEPTFISMEYVEGPNLHYLRAHRPSKVLTWKFLLPLVRQLCEALDYAHGERVLHRDLKPANLMLDGNGRLKLADFGVACVLHDSTTRASGRSATHGTLAYMSPQQANGEQPAITDDIYAIGATVYELMTSQAPFHSGDIGYQVRHNRPQYMHERLADLELANDIPSEVSAMVMACLAKEPGQRPPSARAILDWLDSTDFSKKSAELFVPPPIPAPPAAVAETRIETAPARTLEPKEEKRQPVREEAKTFALATPALEQTVPTPDGPDGREPGASQRSPLRLLLGIGTVVAALSIAVSGVVFYLMNRAADFKPGTAQAAKGKGEEGFESLFNGKDLTGWMGAFKFWSVEEGALVGEFTPKSGLQHGTFLVWQGGEVGDFDLRFSVRGQGNAGVKYRSRTDTQGNLTGYFAPFSKKKAGSILYTGRYSSIRELVAADAAGALHNPGEWNDYRIIARGRLITHEINGVAVANASDDDPLYRSSGLLALELDGGRQPAFKLWFKNIRLKKLN